MMKRFLLAISATVLVCGSAQADGPAIFGPGMVQCGEWQKADNKEDVAITSWILGMASGLESACQSKMINPSASICINGKVKETSQIYERVRFLCQNNDPSTPVYKLAAVVWMYLAKNGQGKE